MKTEFDLSKVDFRTTPLENMFLDTYLAAAPGNALKVYLYGWKKTYFDADKAVEWEELQEELGLTREEVEEAVDFWLGTGLVEEKKEEGDMVYSFKSMVLLWAGLYDQPGEGEEGGSPLPEKQIPSSLEARRRMYDELEDYLSAGLSYRVSLKENEIRTINQLLDQYPISPDFFLAAYKRASEYSEASSRSLFYVTAIVENWIRFEKVTDLASLDACLRKKEADREEKKSRSASERKVENVDEDRRMTKEERTAWVEKKLQASRNKSLRGSRKDGE